MRIVTSSLMLSASHAQEKRQSVRETLVASRGNATQTTQTESKVRELSVSGEQHLRLDLRQGAAAVAFPDVIGLQRRISRMPPAEAAPAPSSSSTNASKEASAAESLDGTGISEPELALIAAFVERMTGHKLRIFVARNAPGETPSAGGGAPPSGVVYRQQVEIHESERTQFQAQGTVQTADGRQINLDLRINMSREFIQTRSTEVRIGAKVKDPLVLNLDGHAAALSNTRFSFDLDADGHNEQIPQLAAGSGYLALDRNGNGKIDNGSELFGPATGNGFDELTRLDGDHNGWIDEADAAWSQLKVWTRDASGNERLVALADAGVGAIYLGQAATPFALRDGNNGDLGQVRASGLFLYEDGRTGSVQQVDLSV